MLRREARLKKEFIYRKSLEEKDRKTQEKRQRLKKALDENQPIPQDLREEASELAEALSFDAGLDLSRSSTDDEYSLSGVTDPKVLVTTSRDPSSRLQQFSKELRLIFPNAQRINRGGHVISEIVDACRANEVTDLIILHEHRGVPDGMIVSHFPHGPTAFFSLSNVVLRHDVPEAMQKKVSEAFPHLIFSNFTTSLGKRTQNILKYLFPVPKDDSRRTISFVNQSDYISFRHHVFVPSLKGGEPELTEIGPRFEMRLFQIKLGTVEADESDVEWVLRPYMNTARKRTFL
jgi:U3 small nucleolar ribonucleoprotein protein IMP4